MRVFESISEQTERPSLYRDTFWGSHTWEEIEPYWKDAIQLIESRDEFAKVWNLEINQPVPWDGDFTKVKHIELYRPYVESGVPPYVACISLPAEDKKLELFGFMPWSAPLYNREHTTYCIQKNTEQEIRHLLMQYDLA